MRDISKAVQNVIDHPNDDFGELVKVAGLNPDKDLRYTNWADTDFGTSDIAGFDFTGSRLNGSDLSRVQNIHLAFFNRNCNPDTTTEVVGTKFPDGFSIETSE